jgi:hypothetical protein
LVLRESVGVADVLRLGIDGHLTLSVRFVNGCKASLGRVVPIAEARHEVVPTLDGRGVLHLLEGVQMRGADTVVVFDEGVVGISEIWDLTMLGAERIDAETLFQQVTAGPDVEMLSLDGPILRSGQIYCRLMTRLPRAKATLYGTLKAIQAFFEWLSREPGYRQAVRISDVAYFTMNANDAKAATAAREQPYPSLKQVVHVLGAMPCGTPLARRDRALIAFILLTGVRDAAAISLKLRHVDLARRQVSQDARDVRTKGAKTFVSSFFPVGDLPLEIVTDWIAEVSGPGLFGPDDPLFPATGDRPRRGGTVLTDRLCAPALVDRRSGPRDLPQGVRGRRPALLLPAQSPPDAHAARPRPEPDSPRAESLEPEPRP